MARLGTLCGRAAEVDLPFPGCERPAPEARAAVDDACLIVEIENDGRTVRSLGLEATEDAD
jgi:hypothetical protein